MAKQPHWETQPTYTAPARNLDDLEHSIEKADRKAAQIRTLIAGEACRAMYRKGSTSLQPFSANSYGLNQLDIPDCTATDPAFGNPVQLKTWTGPWVPVTNPEEIGAIVKEENMQQYNQAPCPPFGSEPLAEYIGAFVETEGVQAALASQELPLYITANLLLDMLQLL